MVIGDGVIANRFIDYTLQKKNIIFAEENYNNHGQLDYDNEKQKIIKTAEQSPEALFVYFSTCHVSDENHCATSSHLAHKTKMEDLVRKVAKKYLILRLPQLIDSGCDKNNFIYSLISNVVEGKVFTLKNSYGNFIDVDDVYLIVNYILSNQTHHNCTLNIASPALTPNTDILNQIEKLLKKKANVRLLSCDRECNIDIDPIRDIIKILNLHFENDYIPKKLSKYYAYLVNPPQLLSIVVPTYNEEHGIEEFYRRTKIVIDSLKPRFHSEIIFVNDYSTDKTCEKLHHIADRDKSVKIINFSRNFGNQIGITAGIDYAKGDAVVIIDDDLQDPPEIILNFLTLWSSGFKVVYGVRPKRQGVNFFFKILAQFYYRLINALSDTNIPNDTGDFRLIDRLVVDKLKLMKEENRYYRGMVAWVGYSQTGWYYERDKRYAGSSTFSLRKYLRFAFNGLTSFTDKPLYFSSLVGFIITLFGFIFAAIIIAEKILHPEITIRGWTSLAALIIFFGGIQLLSIGVVGIYISKIYRESKSRPLYLIDTTENMVD